MVHYELGLRFSYLIFFSVRLLWSELSEVEVDGCVAYYTIKHFFLKATIRCSVLRAAIAMSLLI